LTYEIAQRQQKARILRGIHGVVKPGELMAILGASGAGKSTCLDILGGKAKRGVVSGEILINGKRPTRQQYKRISGFVDQEDKLMGTLTVYETLLYSALLRLPKTMSRAAKERRVRETMV
jgi:ABC-type multidrug transport system ATPase subunit